MASRRLRVPTAATTVRDWRAPRVLLLAAFNSSAWLGHDLINRFRRERFEVFLSYLFGLWVSGAVVLPLVEYTWVLPSPWFLVLIAIGTGQCVVVAIALWSARREKYQRSITLVCVGTWVSTSLVTFVSPPLLPLMLLVALVPVAFAEPYVRWQRGLAFVVINAVSVFIMAALARFTAVTGSAAEQIPPWIETSLMLIALPLNVLHVMVIVWNNAAALRTSEAQLAERAAELEASRTRLMTAADEERRRIERDLHDGAQQHLVSLSVLIQLARNAEHDRARSLLAEATEQVDSAIVEIRSLAHGIYPPLLVSGGLSAALPTLAARAALPVQLELGDLGRQPPSTEAALYYCCSEALQNAAKHGGPGTAVVITAHADEGALTLEIEDTGCGFEPTSFGAGLTNMTDRLSAIGGRLEFDTAPGRGTRIMATVATPGV